MSFPGTSFLPRVGSALLADLYELTMACACWNSGIADREDVFHMTFRQAPFGGGFTIACGLADVVEHVRHFRFTQDDLAYLKTVGRFRP